MTGSRTLVLFTRDLRVHDHPALTAAARAGQVLPLFVLDPSLLTRSPNRSRFLLESLEDLDRSLSERGTPLIVRRGDPGAAATHVASRFRCDAIHVTKDVTSVARRRTETMGTSDIEIHAFPGNDVVEPGAIAPVGQLSYRVFTPYLRAWLAAPSRPVLRPPCRIEPVPGVPTGRRPRPASVAGTAPRLPIGGESVARAAATRFVRRMLAPYVEGRDRLDRDATSRLSPYVRFGCLSANELTSRADGHEAFVRQLAWRDFFRQLVAADPRRTTQDLKPERSPGWRHDPVLFEGWARGETGIPLVDAGMRQLLEQGWMPNRARLITASYLTRTLGLDWRLGAAHFDRHLVDGDPASNIGNWQWVAGTGANPRHGVALNMERQACRFDPDESYRATWSNRGSF